MEPNGYAAGSLVWPSDDDLVAQVRRDVEHVLETFISDKITVTNADANELETLGGIEANAQQALSKEVNMAFTANLDDAFGVMENVRRWGSELTAKIVDTCVANQYPWISYVTIHQHTVLTYNLPAGNVLKQKTGHDRTKVISDDGTLPYAVKLVPAR